MEQKIATFQNKGMTRDLSISKVNNEFAYENFNIRISPRNHDTLLSVTNERGNVAIQLKDNNGNNVSLPNNLIGYAVLNEYIILFFHEEEHSDYIYRVKYNNQDWIATVLFDGGNLGFSLDHPIETLVNYESEDVQKVYWVDGKNQPRFINIKNTYSVNNPYVFDFVTITDTVVKNSFKVIKEYTGSGVFSAGKIKYAITLSNKFGQETNIIYISPEYYTSNKDIANTAEETVNCSFNISFELQDTYNFDFINLYAIQFTGASYSAYKKILPFSKTINYIDTGHYDYSINANSLLFIGGREIIADCLCDKDNTLFLGNLKLKGSNINRELKELIDSTIEEDGESTLVTFEYREDSFIPISDDDAVYSYQKQLDYSEDDIKIYKVGEKYRFGLVLITNTGQRSSVYWIGDKENWLPLTDTYNNTKYPDRIFKAVAVCNINNSIINKIQSLADSSIYGNETIKYTRCVLVRAKVTDNDRTVVAQGIICPTVFNPKQRASNAPFAMSSWIFRPYDNRVPHDMYDPLESNKSPYAEIQSIPYAPNIDNSVVFKYNPNQDQIETKIELEIKAKYWYNRFTFKVQLLYYETAYDNNNDPIRKHDYLYTGKSKFYSGVSTATDVLERLEWRLSTDKTALIAKGVSSELLNNLIKGDGLESLANKIYNSIENYNRNTFTPLISVGTWVPQGISLSYLSSKANELSPYFYVDSSIFTFNTPEISNVNSLDGLNFRIVGAAPVTAEQTSWNIKMDKSSYASDSIPIISDNFIKNVKSDNVQLWSTTPSIQYFNDKNNQTGYIIYPWHKTGGIVCPSKYKDISNPKIESKTIAYFRFSNYTRYLNKNKYWEPDVNPNVSLFRKDQSSTIIKYLGEDKLYYGNYDFIQTTTVKKGNDETSIPGSYYEVYTTGNYTLTNDITVLQNVENWIVSTYPNPSSKDNKLSINSDPVNIAAKSTDHFICTLNYADSKNTIMTALPIQDVVEDGIKYNADSVVPWSDKTPHDLNVSYYIYRNKKDDHGVFPEDTERNSYITISNHNDFIEDFNQYLEYKKDSPIEESNKKYDILRYYRFLNRNTFYLQEFTEAILSFFIPKYSVNVKLTKDTKTEDLQQDTYSGTVSLKIEHAEGIASKFTKIDGKLVLGSVNKIPSKRYSITIFGNSVEYSVTETNAGITLDYEVTASTLENNSIKIDFPTEGDTAINYSCNVELEVNIKNSVEKYEHIFSEEQPSYIYKINNTTEKLFLADQLSESVNELYIKSWEAPILKFYKKNLPNSFDYTVDNEYFSNTSWTADYIPILSYKAEEEKYEHLTSANLLDAGTPFIYIGEFYKEIGDFDYRYGGINEQALLSNTFIDAGDIEEIDFTSDTFSLISKRGDWYYQRYDCLKTIPYSNTKENSVIDIFSCMLETTMNLDGRTDKQRILNDYTLISEESFNTYNNAYSGDFNLITGVILDNDKYSEDEYKNQITWTEEKSLLNDIDKWTNITLASILNLDGDKGPVRAIKRFNNSLISFQDKGISEILFNSRTQLATSEGVPIEIANSGKVDGKRYISNKDGCINKWSIIETKEGIYFIDNINSSISIFNGSIQSLSDIKGFKNWIGQNNSTDIWNPNTFNNFIAFNDKTNDDVYFLRGNNDHNTICYNELLKQFTSFFDYGKVSMLTNVQDKLVSFRDGKLWLQNEGNYNKMFGVNMKPFSVMYRVSPDPYGDKIFTNLEYRADMFDMDKSSYDPYLNNEGELTDNTFDTLEVWNEYQGNKISINENESLLHSLKEKDKYPDVRRKFRIWRMDIPRDKKSSNNPYGLNRIRNPWIYLKLSKTPTQLNERMEFHDLQIKYFE